ncbi:P-loop containing nucleoside triphosphate hydrolase protein [Favolaschia claudopus]|uniref:DNA 3'-5' helicase n=1 Tax=Favolaschia claudopus TaxID=2862362 RepID=A0AAW0E5C8_9AGAR
MAPPTPSFCSDHAVNSREWMEELLRTRAQVREVYPHQLELAMHINAGEDVFCVAGTSMGKTLALQSGPIAAQARGEKGIALMIVPTKVLVEQQADVASRRGLRALAINQDTVRNTRLTGRDLFKELEAGDDIRIAVMTPAMLNEADMKALLRRPSFINSVRWLSIDEAHLVGHDGIFQSGYISLLNMRVRLNSSVIWAAATATATPVEALSMAAALGFHPNKYINARYSVDRPNLKFIPRILQHPTSNGQFLDYSFIIPFDLVDIKQIPETIVFADYIKRGNELEEFLDGLLPPSLPNRDKIIRTYNSLLPFEERQQLIEDFKAGHVRVLIVTDTATYGFDVPNIRLAVLTDLPTSKADKDQKLGRAGRDGLPAVVVAFAPSWLVEPPDGVDPTNPKHLAELERRKKLPPAVVQWYNPTAEKCCRAVTMQHDGEAFIPRPGCCVPICEPDGFAAYLAETAKWVQFFDAKQQTAAEPRIRSDGTFYALEKPMKESMEQMLDRWRHRIWAQIRTRPEEPCEYFLPRHILNSIVNKAHVCTSVERLKTVAADWDYADTHGQLLFDYLNEALTGFSQIFKERAAADGPSSESEAEEDTPGVQLLEKTTLAVLHSFCREFNLPKSGNKSVVVNRVAQYFIS